MHECIQYIWSLQHIHLCPGQEIWGEDFASEAENDSSSLSASRAVLHPKLYVDICEVSWPNRAVPCISMMVLPGLFKLYVGQTTQSSVVAARGVCVLAGHGDGQWCLVKDDTQLRLLGLCKRNWAKLYLYGIWKMGWKPVIFISTTKSFSHLPQCYILIREKQPAGFHCLLESKQIKQNSLVQ